MSEKNYEHTSTEEPMDDRSREILIELESHMGHGGMWSEEQLANGAKVLDRVLRASEGDLDVVRAGYAAQRKRAEGLERQLSLRLPLENQLADAKKRLLELEEMGRAWHDSDEHKHADELRGALEVSEKARERAERIHDELSIITSCGSPSGYAELDQVRLAYEQRAAAVPELDDQQRIINELETQLSKERQEREALREAETEMRNRAARVVDWYFTTYFSKSPGSKAVDELMGLIQTLELRAALAGAPQEGE